ncbi:hypothetical protein ACFL6Y_01770 [Elusimicrobiota bacterium]
MKTLNVRAVCAVMIAAFCVTTISSGSLCADESSEEEVKKSSPAEKFVDWTNKLKNRSQRKRKEAGCGSDDRKDMIKGILSRIDNRGRGEVLETAEYVIRTMLEDSPKDTPSNVCYQLDEIAIVATHEPITVAPCIAKLRNYYDEKQKSDDYEIALTVDEGRCVSIGEEGLLDERVGSPYRKDAPEARRVLVHEFGHVVHYTASDIHDDVKKLFKRSLSKGCIVTAHAETGEMEYFAALTELFFGLVGKDGYSGIEWLQHGYRRGEREECDGEPEIYNILTSLFGGPKEIIKRRARTFGSSSGSHHGHGDITFKHFKYK